MFFSELWKLHSISFQPSVGFTLYSFCQNRKGTTLWGLHCYSALFFFLIFPCHHFFLPPALLGLWDLSSLTRDWTKPWQWQCWVLTTGQPGNSLLCLFSFQRIPVDTALYCHAKLKPELSPRTPVPTLCPHPFSPAMPRDKSQSHKARP